MSGLAPARNEGWPRKPPFNTPKRECPNNPYYCKPRNIRAQVSFRAEAWKLERSDWDACQPSSWYRGDMAVRQSKRERERQRAPPPKKKRRKMRKRKSKRRRRKKNRKKSITRKNTRALQEEYRETYCVAHVGLSPWKVK